MLKYCCIEGLIKYKPFGCNNLGTSIGDKAPKAFPKETIIPLTHRHFNEPSKVLFPTPS